MTLLITDNFSNRLGTNESDFPQTYKNNNDDDDDDDDDNNGFISIPKTNWVFYANYLC